jgi:hypothetical protein
MVRRNAQGIVTEVIESFGPPAKSNDWGLYVELGTPTSIRTARTPGLQPCNWELRLEQEEVRATRKRAAADTKSAELSQEREAQAWLLDWWTHQSGASAAKEDWPSTRYHSGPDWSSFFPSGSGPETAPPVVAGRSPSGSGLLLIHKAPPERLPPDIRRTLDATSSAPRTMAWMSSNDRLANAEPEREPESPAARAASAERLRLARLELDAEIRVTEEELRLAYLRLDAAVLMAAEESNEVMNASGNRDRSPTWRAEAIREVQLAGERRQQWGFTENDVKRMIKEDLDTREAPLPEMAAISASSIGVENTAPLAGMPAVMSAPWVHIPAMAVALPYTMVEMHYVAPAPLPQWYGWAHCCMCGLWCEHWGPSLRCTECRLRHADDEGELALQQTMMYLADNRT